MMSKLGYLTATDIKHYAYCPVIVYITHVLGLSERETEYMEYAKEIHEEQPIAPAIRKYRAVKAVRKPLLVSKKLRLVGKPDYILITRIGEHIPFEIKWAEPARGGRAKKDHALQMAAYALLIEEKTGKTVKRGAIYYLRPQGSLIQVNISYDLKLRARKAIRDAWRIVQTGTPPNPKRRHCGHCNYKPYCPHQT